MKRKFLFQVDDFGDLLFDFQFVVYNYIKDGSFGYHKQTIDTLKSYDKITNATYYIPIGSIEFVTAFFKIAYNIDLKPINIPSTLFSSFHLRRICSIWTKEE